MCAKGINSKLGRYMHAHHVPHMPSMWRVQLDENTMVKFVMWSRQRCLPPIPFTGKRVKQITRTCKSSPITVVLLSFIFLSSS